MNVAMRDLERAADHGVEIRNALDGVFVTSATYPNAIYRVDVNHCDCLGFFYRGHCKHHALFMANLWDRTSRFFGR